MSNIHNNGENDKSLNEGLDRLGQAYGQLPHDEPPDLLDQAILNSAHRAVQKKPHWMKFGWLHGLTTAAVFVLALSIIINQRQQVPVYESGGRDNGLGSLQREKVAKKQSADTPSADMRMEMKEKSENRQDDFQGVPATAAAKTGATQTDITNEAPRPAIQAERSFRVQESLPAKADSVDADTQGNEAVLEELLLDETNLIVETPDPAMISKRSRPAAEAEYVSGEIGANAEPDTEKEKTLQNIIRLKESGDKTWVTELELFKQKLPRLSPT